MTDSLLIRTATVDDAAGIARVRVRGWQAGYRGIVPQNVLDAMSIEANTERIRSWDWDSKSAKSWVCLRDGEAVGWTSVFWPCRDVDLAESVGEIAACYAIPEVWGQTDGPPGLDPCAYAHDRADRAAVGASCRALRGMAGPPGLWP